MISGAVGEERQRAALGLVVSAMLVAAVGVGTYLFDPDLSEVRPSFGSGINSSTGSRVVHDFLADQDAAAKAQATGDQGQLEGYLTGNALQDVAQQIASNPLPPNSEVKVRLESLSVIQARDPNDPGVVIEVQEDAVKTFVTHPQNAAPSEQSVSFHGDFWMREANGRYAITDQVIRNEPTSALPAIGLGALALVWVAAAALLVLRSRSLRATPAAVPSTPQPAGDARRIPTPTPPAVAIADKAELVVRTFGGLHLLHDGKDWVQSLDRSPVTRFVWQRLLVGTIRDPAFRPSRDELARQASPPALDRNTQLKRVRNFVYQLRELPAALKDRIVVAPQALSFNLEGCEVDAVNLLKASAATSGRATLEASETIWAQRVFDESAGTFLPDFEQVDDLVTDHHPTCSELIRELRETLIGKRIDLAIVLADTYSANGRPVQSIAVLEPMLREREQRKDLADRLAAAYRSAGRDAEAEALAARFG